MPRVFEEDGFSFFFTSNDGAEPPHIHVRKDGRVAKFWLEPEVALSKTGHHSARDLMWMERTIRTRRDMLLAAWHEHFPR